MTLPLGEETRDKRQETRGDELIAVFSYLVISVAPSPAGGLFATGSGDMRARIWRSVSKHGSSSRSALTNVTLLGMGLGMGDDAGARWFRRRLFGPIAFVGLGRAWCLKEQSRFWGRGNEPLDSAAIRSRFTCRMFCGSCPDHDDSIASYPNQRIKLYMTDTDVLTPAPLPSPSNLSPSLSPHPLALGHRFPTKDQSRYSH